MRCNVCYLPIHDEATKILCPRCTNAYHRDHLAAWLLNEEKCPVCREVLSDEFRDDLKPKTEKERVRLENILGTLDGIGEVLGSWETGKRNKKRVKEMRKLNPNEKAPSLLKWIILGSVFVLWILFLLIMLISNLAS